MHATLANEPPEFDSLRNIPPSLDRIVRRCLEKRQEDRFHSAHDLALALEAVTGSRSQPVATVAPEPKSRRPWLTARLAAAVGVAAEVEGAPLEPRLAEQQLAAPDQPLP